MVWTLWTGQYGLDNMVWTLAEVDNFRTLFFFSLSQVLFYSSDRETKYRYRLTLEHGAHLLPGSHGTLSGVLAYGHPEEEQRQTAGEEGQTIRDEEGTCK